MAVAVRATITPRSLPSAPPALTCAARCAREEDDAIGAARDVPEGADHLGLAPARLGLERDGRPHALLELVAELRDETLLVAGHLHVALGDQLLAVSRAHPQELHVAIMSRAPPRASRPARQPCAVARLRSGRIRRPARLPRRSSAGRRGPRRRRSRGPPVPPRAARGRAPGGPRARTSACSRSHERRRRGTGGRELRAARSRRRTRPWPPRDARP